MLRTLWLLLSVLLLAASSVAFSLEDMHIDGIEAYLLHGVKRQASGTGVSPPPPPSSTTVPPPPTTSQRPPTSSQPPTPSPPSTTDEQKPPSSTDQSPKPTPSSSQGNNQPSSTSAKPANDTPSPTQRLTPTTRVTPVVTVSRQSYTSVVPVVTDGSTVYKTTTGYSDVPVTIGSSTIVESATVQTGASNGKSLSQSNKNVIGGVVGGVGGALLIGGIALVFLRMKKRQARVHEDDDDMTLGTGSALGDKPHSAHGATPFHSNLEQYHNPGGRPNAAANF